MRHSSLLLLFLCACAPETPAPPSWEELEQWTWAATRGGPVQVAPGDPVLGDLDGRRGDELLVVLTESGEAGEVWVYLAIVRGPQQLATLALGDRVAIQKLAIEQRRVVAEIVVAAPDDPTCCPTLRRRIHLRLEGDQLTEEAREDLGRIER